MLYSKDDRNYMGFDKYVVKDRLSIEEEQELIRQLKTGNRLDARNKLIESNSKFVFFMAKKLKDCGLDYDEVVSAVYYGLLKAVDTFDVDKGYTLSTYAQRCMTNEVLMRLRKERRYASRQVYLDAECNNDTDTDFKLIDRLYSDADDIFDAIYKSEQLQAVTSLLGKLKETERKVIKLYFGIDREHGMKQREIAVELGISRTYVSKKLNEGLEKLRVLAERQGIEY